MKRLAIIGLGPSSHLYFVAAEGAGNRSLLFDEVWTVNTYASVIKADIVWHMDDIRVQMARAPGNEKIAALVESLRDHQGRVITSRVHPDFPCLEAYPLETIVREFGSMYFNNTLAYAMAYAIWQKFDEVTLYGVDYNYQDGSSHVEPGRACMEYWIGRATERGVQVTISSMSTLMDTNCSRLYGYDTTDIIMQTDAEGAMVALELNHRDDVVIDASKIEQLYDHSPRKVA